MACFIRVRVYSIILHDSVSTAPFALLDIASDTLPDEPSLNEDKEVLLLPCFYC